MDSVIQDVLEPNRPERSDAAKQYRSAFQMTERRSLVRLCQAMNYGVIQDLEIRASEPVFDPPPRVLTDVKLDAAEGARQEIQLTDLSFAKRFAGSSYC